MIIREILEKEYCKRDLLSSVAFEGSVDYEKIMKEDYTGSTAKESVCGFTTKSIGAFSDDEETLYSMMLSIPYRVDYDSNDVMMSGIGNVATLPPYRRKGGIRECFKYLFPILKENNFPLSFLYPFNFAYYRQFGYEVSSATKTYTIDFKGLTGFNTDGESEFLTPESDHQIIHEIFTKMYQNYNLASKREKHNYNYFYERNTYKDNRYAYIYKDKNGTPKGYMMFKKEIIDGKTIMDCVPSFPSKNDFVFVDTEGLMGLLDLAFSFRANYDSIRIKLPENIMITDIANSNFVTSTHEYLGMVRVIDAEKILKISKYKGSGSAKIKINDKYVDDNNATFYITFENGKCTDIKKTTEDFDVEMDIATFSSLIVGTYHSIKDCLRLDLNIKANSENLDKIFYYKPTMVLDLF